MSLVKISSAEASSVELSCSVLSFVSCTFVALSIVKDKKNARSYHLQLVLRLLLSDAGLSFSYIIYFFIQFILTEKELETFCNVFLPVALYFFLCAYGWTVFLAFKFRRIHDANAAPSLAITPPAPMWSVWVVCGVLCFAVLIMGLVFTQLTVVDNNKEDTNQSCTFNHHSEMGNIVNLIAFQIPLLLTILANLYYYTNGIIALRTSPHSVVARQMRRAGGYIGVLLLVWIPTMFYNAVVIFKPSEHRDLENLLDIGVIMAASQGFLNAFVYVWCNQTMRLWIKKHFYIFKSKVIRTESTVPEITKDEGEDEDEDADERWLQDSLSFSGRDSDVDGSAGSYTAPDVNGMVTGGGGGGEPQATADVENPVLLTKSILIMREANAEAAAAHNKKKDKRGVRMATVDLDHERYVRFGE